MLRKKERREIEKERKRKRERRGVLQTAGDPGVKGPGWQTAQTTDKSTRAPTCREEPRSPPNRHTTRWILTEPRWILHKHPSTPEEIEAWPVAPTRSRPPGSQAPAHAPHGSASPGTPPPFWALWWGEAPHECSLRPLEPRGWLHRRQPGAEPPAFFWQNSRLPVSPRKGSGTHFTSEGGKTP